jgi:hypothetical protein
MTVQDLLRHTSGLTYAHLTGPHIKQAYEAANVVDERQNNAAMAENLGRVPLAYQPGNPKRCRFAATSVQYNAVVLKNDLPFSKDASNIEFDPNKPLLTLISGEPTVSAVCVTGLGVVKMVLIGDFFLERRHRHKFLDRSATGTDCHSVDASAVAAAALPLPHAHA